MGAVLASTAPQIYAMAAALAVLALGLIAYGIRLVRVTRHDPTALAPLEVMGTRAWRRAATPTRADALDAARPAGANPLPDVVAEAEEVAATAVEVDEAVEDADITSAIVADVEPVADTTQLDDVDDVEDVEVVEVLDTAEEVIGVGAGEPSDDATSAAGIVDIDVVEVLDTAAET